MRASCVVVNAPTFDDRLGLFQAVKDVQNSIEQSRLLFLRAARGNIFVTRCVQRLPKRQWSQLLNLRQ
jgi:hypothetical protein